MISGEDVYWEKEYKRYLAEVKLRSIFSFDDYSPAKSYSQRAILNRIIYPILSKTKKTCLELGSGSGFILSLLSKMQIRCVGVDNSEKAIEFSKYICQQRRTQVTLINENIFNFVSKEKFSLVFNSGVIEHFKFDQQDLLIKKMVSLSNKYILVCIPNNNSPLYLDFIDYVKKKGNFYNVKEYPVNMEKLFRKNKVRLILKDGFHIFNSKKCYLNHRRKKIFKFYRTLSIRLGKIYLNGENFFSKDYNKKDIKLMTLLENIATPEERFKFGFMRLYLGVIESK
ncbi:class I SAM-dependent methyltransferase [Candidatus Woesearchaeota archaeon]|nr:class I SAM-dependent methyltransferase [Candidatus Woesearchaeota archaeon]